MADPRLPGFTASAALGRSRQTYKGGGTPSAQGGGRRFSVQVQAAFPSSGRDCIPGCLCVTPVGCPCCGTLFPPLTPDRWLNDTYGHRI